MVLDDVRSEAPLAGVIVCCSALKTEERDEIHRAASEMGARCTFDLTLENTHLVIGDSKTLKYQYVAKERPDVKIILPSFITAVRAAWMAGGLVNIGHHEDRHKAPALYGLSVCLTGFTDATERAAIIQKISNNGARYDGDLSRHTTSHLIARSATGKKYQMAPQWDIAVVTEEWLHDSVERGMALQDSYFSFSMPAHRRGHGAWNRCYQPAPTSPGKRNRDDAAATEALGRRKIRRTMSYKLSNEHDAIWANITGLPDNEKPQHASDGDELTTNETEVEDIDTKGVAQNLHDSYEQPHILGDRKASSLKIFPKPKEPGNTFSGVHVFIHGFTDPRKIDVLQAHLGSHGATFVDTKTIPNDEICTERLNLVMIPAETPTSDLPPIPESLCEFPRVTQWWLESCLYEKRVVGVSEDRFYEPFFKGEISGFKPLKCSSTGFENIPRLNVGRVIKQLGGDFEERIHGGISVLICNKDSSKPDRRDAAMQLGIPVVTSDWLLACVQSYQVVPVDKYLVGPKRSVPHLKHDARDAMSFETMNTLSVPSGDIEKQTSERSRTRSEDETNPSGAIAENSPLLDEDIDTAPPRDEDTHSITEAPMKTDFNEVGLEQQRAQSNIRPLQPVLAPRLNSPTKPSSPAKNVEMKPTQEENSSSKSEQINSALVAMLAEKKLSRQSSNNAKERRPMRRKRTALGRALSSSTNPVHNSNSRQCSPQKAISDLLANEGVAKQICVASQKLVYEENETRTRHQKLIAEIGGSDVVGISASKVGKKKSTRSKAKKI